MAKWPTLDAVRENTNVSAYGFPVTKVASGASKHIYAGNGNQGSGFARTK